MSTLPDALAARVRQSVDERTLDLVAERGGIGRRRGWLIKRALLAADLLGLTVSFTIAEQLYARDVSGDHLARASEYWLFALSLPAWVVVAKLYGLYDRDEERADHSTADDVAGVFHLVTIGSWLLYVSAALTQIASPALAKLFAFWLLAIVSIPVFRSAARAYCRRRVEYLQNTLVLGTDSAAQTVARKLLAHPEYGLNLVGFVDSAPFDLDPDLSHLSVLGATDEVPQLVSLLDVERVIVSFVDQPYEETVDLVRTLNSFEVQVDIVPRLHDVLSPAVDVHTVEGVPLIGLRPPSLSGSSAFLKRSLDIIGSVTGLVLLAPLFAVVAVAIKLDSRGPVFFRQVRMGCNGKSFRILKFRTMCADAEEQKPNLIHLNKHLRGDARMFKIAADPRVTHVGGALRRFSVDELPQLWNVLRGDMSLVGPRPLILAEDAHVLKWARRRSDLRPGMTGLWQVLGRDDIPFQEMVRLDYVYVTSWSLAADIRLLIRTIPRVVAGMST